ncbi:hypothetical protein ACFXPI_02410 [Streptomyces sp. NPDC059104]|uniref:hypothetical protein n=1 Tax=Streptomyces sp. NPDC059104 TaxID=3346729 RepID=UPI0036865FFB
MEPRKEENPQPEVLENVRKQVAEYFAGRSEADLVHVRQNLVDTKARITSLGEQMNTAKEGKGTLSTRQIEAEAYTERRKIALQVLETLDDTAATKALKISDSTKDSIRKIANVFASDRTAFIGDEKSCYTVEEIRAYVRDSLAGKKRDLELYDRFVVEFTSGVEAGENRRTADRRGKDEVRARNERKQALAAQKARAEKEQKEKVRRRRDRLVVDFQNPLEQYATDESGSTRCFLQIGGATYTANSRDTEHMGALKAVLGSLRDGDPLKGRATDVGACAEPKALAQYLRTRGIDVAYGNHTAILRALADVKGAECHAFTNGYYIEPCVNCQPWMKNLEMLSSFGS